MDARTNPYSPGAGLRPPELAGREKEIEAFDVLRHRAVRGRSSQSIVLYGLRGVGKTVLLNDLAGAAAGDDWITAKVEADLSGSRVSFQVQVVQALKTSLRHAQGRSSVGERFRRMLKTFSSFSLSVGIDGSLTAGVDLKPVVALSGSLQTDLTDLAIDLGNAAAELGVGVALFVDEMQHLTKEELAAVCQACHETGQRSLPFFVIGAGLPNLPGVLAEAKSYAERLFHYVEIDRLTAPDAAAALTRPAAEENVIWAQEAITAVVEASGGYPYFVQQFGKTCWEVAQQTPITDLDAAEGIRLGRQQLDNGFFLARWERATPSERGYLTAMATHGNGPSQSADVATRLTKKPSALGPVRAKLIDKGLVYAPEYGLIAFTVPGMADFIHREIART